MNKRIITTAGLAGLIALAVCAMGSLDSLTPAAGQQGFRYMRTVTTNDTALTAATATWTTVGASAAFVPIRAGWTWVSVSAIGYGDGDGAGDPSAGTFSYRVLGARRGASAQIICNGAMAVGGLQLSHSPYGSNALLSDATSYRWVEGPPTITDYWPTGAMVAGTTDDIGSVSFATNGLMGFTVEVTAMANVTSVIIVYTGGE